MPKKIKLFLNNEQKVSKLIFGVLMIGLAVLVAGNGAFAYFQRDASDGTIFKYGYGYGYGVGQEYGYGYGSSVSGYNDYGFGGVTGKATSLSAAQSGNSRLVIGYTTEYYAKNKVYYGLVNTACTSLGSNTALSAFETGANSVTISDLTCATTYYYCVTSEDMGGNVWRTSVTSADTAACGGSGGGGGGYVAPIIPATTTVATTTVATTTITTGDTTIIKPISQMTVAELRAKVVEIGKLIVALRAELAKLVGAPATPLTIKNIPVGFSFSKTLKLGTADLEVKYLQVVLNSDSDTQLTGQGIGSSGKETDYFGGKTKQAVIKFQEKYKAEILTPAGLANGNGLVGPSTRTKLNSLYGGQ